MLVHPEFDPVAVHLGPLAVRWYGLMYLAGFALFWLLGRKRAADAWRGITKRTSRIFSFTASSASFSAAVSDIVFFISRAFIWRIRSLFSRFGKAA